MTSNASTPSATNSKNVKSATTAPVPPQSTYQNRVAAYWNAEENPVNLELGRIDDLYHHHYGVGNVDWSVLDETGLVRRRERITAELHRLEQAQAELLASHLGPLSPADRVFDAGCGRGGGSVVAHLRYGCEADGVTISGKQADFANEQARRRDIADKVRYHHRDMLDTGFASGAYAASWNNESTMYVELDLLFAEHARLLRRGGRYVTITGCYDDTYGRASREVSLINAHYICDIHPRSEYFRALARNRLVPVHVQDLTSATVPYWELRKEADHLVTGIEDAFLTAYANGSFQYLLIVADRV
ncbi:geranyl diphosphate 2-C-methyltransferase [Streptomyces poonensis]|nr:geranyl diphosphate 2-C-methyltransferase [Streptomyces poonensis]GLJ89585.1 methyltransferase [Streptomyces poonensis]